MKLSGHICARDPQRTWELDLGIAVEQREESTAICLEGTIDIASAAELKTTLLDALGRGNPVCLSLASNVDLDVTAIQLLWAAEHKARTSGVEFKLAGPLPEPLRMALKESGFERFPVPV
jgi:anti-anti-sigma regulatory factor